MSRLHKHSLECAGANHDCIAHKGIHHMLQKTLNSPHLQFTEGIYIGVVHTYLKHTQAHEDRQHSLKCVDIQR